MVVVACSRISHGTLNASLLPMVDRGGSGRKIERIDFEFELRRY